MTIQASAQQTPIVPVSVGLPVGRTDSLENVYANRNSAIALQQMHDFIVNMCRSFPCNASMASNVITLTLLPSQPTLDQYTSYDSFLFVAPANSTGSVTALVQTSQGSLATLNVYRNTTTQAGSGDITANGLYRLTFNDALNAGAGGFLREQLGAGSLVTLTNSSGGVVSNTIAAVSGSGDDTHINNNFASLTVKVDAIMTALGLT